MRSLLLLTTLLCALLSPGLARAEAGETPLRITSPLPGQYAEPPASDVVIEGPPGAAVVLRIDERKPVIVTLDESGIGRYSPDRAPDLPTTYTATIEEDGAVVDRAGVLLTALEPASPVVRWRPNGRSRRINAYGTALACGYGAAFLGLMLGEVAAGGVQREEDFYKGVSGAGLSVALAPVAVMACLNDVKNPGHAWAAVAGSVTVGLLGLGIMSLVRDDEEDLVTMTYSIALMAPFGAMLGAAISVQLGPDMMGAGYSTTF